MKRILVAAAVLALGTAGAGVSLADPGPNGHNNWGLCNAYSHNGGNSHGKSFVALAETAGDYDGDGDRDADDVTAWCADNGQKPGGGKG